MTSDDERWERDLRTSIGAVLEDVRPGQPPVAAVLRKGRAMRLSRRLAVAGGAAAVVAAALVIPAALRGGRADILEVIAYSGDTKIAYSDPYYGGALRPGTYFVSWLSPGQHGPAEHARYIATGGSGGNGWDAFVEAGPWGFCVSLNAPVPDGAQQNCWSPASLRARPRVIMRGGSPPAVPRWIVGAAGPSVAYLRMTLASGRSVKVRVAVFSGQGFTPCRSALGPPLCAGAPTTRPGTGCTAA